MAEGAALQVHLHPLVLINISDHVVRYRASGREGRVLGAVIGDQEGRHVQMHNSFELSIEGEVLDVDYFKLRLAQYQEVFPRYEFLGWYSIGKSPQASDHALHKKIQEVTNNETPFLLMMDSESMGVEKAAQGNEELPIKVYDATTHIAGGELQVNWNEVQYVIDTLEAERISVNHVAKSATTATAGHSSDFTQHAGGLANSVVMLSNRVKELLEYMKDVKEGRAPKNHEVLRQLLSICQALRATQPDAMRQEFRGEFNDAALVVLLATLTKTSASTADLLDKFQLMHDKKHRRAQHYPFS
jgi:COP9 signalosome complex subunit 6